MSISLLKEPIRSLRQPKYSMPCKWGVSRMTFSRQLVAETSKPTVSYLDLYSTQENDLDPEMKGLLALLLGALEVQVDVDLQVESSLSSSMAREA